MSIAAHDRCEIASLFPLDLSGDVVPLRAGVDATTRESGVFSVAGVAFGYDRAVKANREWERLMDGRTFRMSDLNARVCDFEGISKEEVRKIMVGCVSIIRRYASYYTALSCDFRFVADVLPTVSSDDISSKEMLAALRSPYGFMCHLSMYSLGGLVSAGKYDKREISYIFERGDAGQKGLIRFLNYLEELPGAEFLLDSYSLSRKTVTPKDEMEGIFHASDLVAWEWAKHVDRHRGNHPIRTSLEKLVNSEATGEDQYGITISDGKNFLFRHYERESLERRMPVYRDLLSASSAQEVSEALTRWRAEIEK